MPNGCQSLSDFCHLMTAFCSHSRVGRTAIHGTQKIECQHLRQPKTTHRKREEKCGDLGQLQHDLFKLYINKIKNKINVIKVNRSFPTWWNKKKLEAEKKKAQTVAFRLLINTIQWELSTAVSYEPFTRLKAYGLETAMSSDQLSLTFLFHPGFQNRSFMCPALLIHSSS